MVNANSGTVVDSSSDHSYDFSISFPAIVPYEKFAMALFGQPASRSTVARMLAICAEPGMGRGEVIAGILARSSRLGVKTLRRNLANLSSDDAVRAITRAAREVSRADERMIVAFDEIPASDEGCVRRQVAALRRIVEAGTPVVFSLTPEARQLLEGLPECGVLWSGDLVSQGLLEVERMKCAAEMRALTRGIPSLVRVFGGTSFISSDRLPQAYYDALGTIVSLSVRHGLCDEELRLRLGMILLGRGTIGELREVVGGVTSEELGRLRTDAPYFGVTSGLDGFSCILPDSPYALAVSLPRVTMTCALFPDVPSAAVRLLVANGEFGRAAALCRLLDCRDADEIVVRHACDFIEVGEVALVRRSVESLGALLRDGEDFVVTLFAATEMLGRRHPATGAPTYVKGCVEGMMLLDARLVLRGEKCPVADADRSVSELSGRLAVHRLACELMASGMPNAALRLLVSHPCERSGPSVSTALLDVDLELARLLVGDGAQKEGEHVEDALRLLSSPELEGLSGYVALLGLVRRALSGDVTAGAEADALVARSEHVGDSLVRCVALIVGCICDLRGRTYARANVRSLLGASVAQSMGNEYLARVADLLGDIARYLMGERVEVRPGSSVKDDLEAVRGFVQTAMAGASDSPAGRRDYDSVPRDALWLLGLLTQGLGEYSQLLRERMPREWRRALMLTGEAGGLDSGGDGAKVLAAIISPNPLSTLPGEGTAPIEVTLLGGMAVYVRGVRIPDWKLEHRNAKSMLEFLVLQHGASAKRFQLVEQVWPECDYATGFNRAYQATSSLRSAIAEIEPGLDPFVTGRMSKEVALDMGLVRSDVDVFRALAREASDCPDDAQALMLARKAERIYAGDLYMPPADATGYVAGVRAELRELYGDAMVAGADAALRLGQERTAGRLASDALMADDLREDAMLVLIRALKAAGRVVEADQQYRRYASRLMREGKRGPSSELRHALREEGEGPTGARSA